MNAYPPLYPQPRRARVCAALAAGLVALASGCSNGRGFGSATPAPLRAAPATADDAVRADYVFRLRPQKAGFHSKDSPVPLLSEVGILPGGRPLVGPQTRGWKVTLLGADNVVLAKDVDLGAALVTLSSPKAEESVTALFNHSSIKVPGRAQAKVLFDLEAPSGTVTWWPALEGARSDVRWTFSRGEDVDASKSAVVVCADAASATAATDAYTDNGTLPASGDPSCRVIAGGSALAEGVATAIDPATEALLRRPDPRVLLLVRDAVGNAASLPGQKLQAGQSTLQLEASSAQRGTLREPRATVDVSLFRLAAGGRTPLAGGDWILELESDAAGVGKRIVDLSRTVELGGDFLKQGRQLVILRASARNDEVATREGVRGASNEIRFEWIVDNVGPALGSPLVSVPAGQILQGSQIGVQWSVRDDSGIASQVVEYRTNDTEEWQKLQDIQGDAQAITKAWDSVQKTPALSVRVRAVDALGNESVSAATRWREQIFNLAVLTKSVECFWCHMKIVGDVGAIFPSSPNIPEVHAQAGRRFSMTGRFFSNKAVPAFPGATTDFPADPPRAVEGPFGLNESQKVANYNNDPMQVFPKNYAWPVLEPSRLRAKMNGLVRGTNPISGTVVSVDRSISGNLALVGTMANPITISGEVLVEGDLVIAGVYTGVGTIYARNVFVANDLVAKNSPFPFPADAEAAIAAAKQAIIDRKDGLYLAALQDMIVGSPESASKLQVGPNCPPGSSALCFEPVFSECPPPPAVPREDCFEPIFSQKGGIHKPRSTPYAWLPKSKFRELGRRAEFPVVRAYKQGGETRDIRLCIRGVHNPMTESDPNCPGKVDDLSSDRSNMEVSRIDAFLYAGRVTQIRQFLNVLVNGGIMSPELDLLTTVMQWKIDKFLTEGGHTGYRWGLASNPGEVPPVNPRNGLHVRFNEIRFDWRLRAGGGGLEVLKEFFE